MFYKPKTEKFVENEFVQINLNPELSFLSLLWKQHPASEQFRNGYRIGIELALQYKVKYWLANARSIYYLSQSDQSWLLSKMSPLLSSDALLKYAIVMEPDCFLMTQHKPDYSNSEQQQESSKAKNFQIFIDEELAYSWLFSDINISNTTLTI